MADKHSKTVKAQRATIDIGGITINVYQLPDGSYRLAGRNVTDAIGEVPMSLSRYYGVKTLKALPHADASLSQVQADTGESFIPVSIIDALAYWGEMGFEKRNPLAKAIVLACAAETIERRADRAFDVKRTEEQYDETLKARVESIKCRLDFGKEVQRYCLSNPDVSATKASFMYGNATDRLYQVLTGVQARKLREIHGLPPRSNLREWLTETNQVKALSMISAIETLAAHRINAGDDPMEVMAEAATPYAGALSYLCKPIAA